MKIDFTLDFDAILEEAKQKRKEYDDIVDKHRHTYNCDPSVMSYPPKVKPILKAAHEKWLAWVKANITSRGLGLVEDALGRPTAITAVLAREIK